MMNKTNQTHVWSRITLLVAVAFVVLHFSAFRVFAAVEDGTTPETAYSTKAGLASDIKGKLLARATTSDRIYFTPEGTEIRTLEQLKAYISDSFDLALEHDNTNPKAGDYIRENLASQGYGCGMSGGYCYVTLNVSYLASAPQEEDVYTALDAAVAGLNLDGKTDLDKAKAVYAYVRDNVSYDYTYTRHSTYNAAIEHTSVCQGYASMLYYMMLKAGIDCRVITGNGNGGPHAWNIIKLSGAWYNVDVTFDSSANTGYMHFLFSDGTFETETYGAHFRGNGVNEEGKKVGIDYTSAEFKSKYHVSEDDNPFVSLTPVTLKGASAFTNSYVILEFVFNIPDEAQDALVTFTFPTNGDIYNTYSLVSKKTKDADGNRTFQCRVPAKNMTDDIKACVSYGNNKSNEFSISVKDYAMSVYSETQYSYYKELVAAMLTYGAYSQLYFGYNTDKLANSDLSFDPVKSESIRVPVEYDGLGRNFTKPVAQGGISYDSSSLMLKYGVGIRHYFVLDDPATLSDYTFTVNGNKINPQTSGNKVYIQIDGIRALDLNADRTVNVKKGDTTLMTFNYTPMDYTKIVTVRYNKGDTVIPQKLSELCKSLYIYYRINRKHLDGTPEGDVSSQTWKSLYPISF